MDKEEIIKILKDLRTQFAFGWFQNGQDKMDALSRAQNAVDEDKEKLRNFDEKGTELSDADKIDKARLEKNIEGYNNYIDIANHNYQADIDYMIEAFNNGELGKDGLKEKIDNLKASGRGDAIPKVNSLIESRFQAIEVILNPEAKKDDPEVQEKGKELIEDLSAKEPGKGKMKSTYENASMGLQQQKGKLGYFLKRFVLAILTLGFLQPLGLALGVIGVVLARDMIKETKSNSKGGNSFGNMKDLSAKNVKDLLEDEGIDLPDQKGKDPNPEKEDKTEKEDETEKNSQPIEENKDIEKDDQSIEEDKDLSDGIKEEDEVKELDIDSNTDKEVDNTKDDEIIDLTEIDTDTVEDIKDKDISDDKTNDELKPGIDSKIDEKKEDFFKKEDFLPFNRQAREIEFDQSKDIKDIANELIRLKDEGEFVKGIYNGVEINNSYSYINTSEDVIKNYETDKFLKNASEDKEKFKKDMNVHQEDTLQTSFKEETISSELIKEDSKNEIMSEEIIMPEENKTSFDESGIDLEALRKMNMDWDFANHRAIPLSPVEDQNPPVKKH